MEERGLSILCYIFQPCCNTLFLLFWYQLKYIVVILLYPCVLFCFKKNIFLLTVKCYPFFVATVVVVVIVDYISAVELFYKNC